MNTIRNDSKIKGEFNSKSNNDQGADNKCNIEEEDLGNRIIDLVSYKSVDPEADWIQLMVLFR